MNSIYKRRSIRSYNDKNIDDDILISLVKAGMNAPSAKNLRTSEFIIIDEKKVLNELSIISPNYFMLSKCNKAVVVIGKKTSDFFQQDLAASTQNILLEATNFYISSCWMGVYPKTDLEESVKKVLNVSSDYVVLSIISLGYSDKEKEENDFFDKNKIYFNKFMD